jgi:preprotein translocase subunit SecA
VRLSIPPESVQEQWDIPVLKSTLAADYQLERPSTCGSRPIPSCRTSVRERVREAAKKQYETKVELVGREFPQVRRNLMLQTVDQHWREHLAALDHLRRHTSARLRKEPEAGIQTGSFRLFSDARSLKQDVVKIVLTVRVQTRRTSGGRGRPGVGALPTRRYEQALAPAPDDAAADRAAAVPRAGQKVGRNDMSVRINKYKHCHGRLA